MLRKQLVLLPVLYCLFYRIPTPEPAGTSQTATA